MWRLWSRKNDRRLTLEINFRRAISYPGWFILAVIYFVLAKGGLPALLAFYPTVTGYDGLRRCGVGISDLALKFVAVFIATRSAGSVATAIAIATGNSLEAVVGAYLINRWSSDVVRFRRQNAKFALIAFVIAHRSAPALALTSRRPPGIFEMG